MDEDLLGKIMTISGVFASAKRVIILEMLKGNYMGYNNIKKFFDKMGVPIGSSEIYKHLAKLEKNGFITKKEKRYTLTERGDYTAKVLSIIMDVNPKEPTLDIAY